MGRASRANATGSWDSPGAFETPEPGLPSWPGYNLSIPSCSSLPTLATTSSAWIETET